METLPRRYPLGIQTFQKIIEENMLYVDKTELIYKLTQSYSYVFLSRPRRFGKSLLVSTLASYFRGEKELFKGLAMERLEKQWKKHPVIHLSLASVKEIEPEKIRSLLNGLLAEQEKFYGIDSASDTLGGRLKNLITSCYEKYGEKVVVILDEYDAPLLNVLHDEERVKDVRQLMRTLYAPLKDCDPYLRFVFITGISKFSQLSIFSEINNLKVISMMPEYSTLCGFTQQEIETNFQEGIKRLAEKEELTVEQTLDKLRQTYDGYHFAANSPGVYNPYSIINALSDGTFDNYWFSTGTPSFLVEMLRKFHTDISRIDGSTAEAPEFDAPTEDMRSILPLFYQSGYLTIKHYESQFELYTLGFPNKEVRNGLMRALYPYYITPNTDGRALVLMNISKGFMYHDVESAMQTLQ
ncbi:MAG: AAA family ATPase, partial [Bacteroidaceae bacterium]|nr:AAA family ATPase [Bacteroidaceae bacterium]